MATILTGLEILDDVQWYAITNMGTGNGNPHAVVLGDGVYFGRGDSLESVEDAIEKAYDDLLRKSAL